VDEIRICSFPSHRCDERDSAKSVTTLKPHPVSLDYKLAVDASKAIGAFVAIPDANHAEFTGTIVNCLHGTDVTSSPQARLVLQELFHAKDRSSVEISVAGAKI